MFKTIFLTLPFLSKRLQCSFFKSTSLYISLFLYLFSNKITKKGNEKIVKICINGMQRNFSISDPIDIVALREVFVDGEYDLYVENKPQIILDLGAHVGDTALFYHDMYPDAKIYAIEAMPNTFEKLKKNVQGIVNIIPLNAAVTAKTGQVSFFQNASSLGNSIHQRESGGEEFVVPSFSLTDLLESINQDRVDILKFDIEGSEADLFAEIDTGSFAENYIGEIHLDLGVESNEQFAKQFTQHVLSFSEISRGRRYLFTATKK
jgi:FkbM family methyltransferase